MGTFFNSNVIQISPHGTYTPLYIANCLVKSIWNTSTHYNNYNNHYAYSNMNCKPVTRHLLSFTQYFKNYINVLIISVAFRHPRIYSNNMPDANLSKQKQEMLIKDTSHLHLLVNTLSIISLIAWVMKHSRCLIAPKHRFFHVNCLLPSNPGGDNNIAKLCTITINRQPFHGEVKLPPK